MNNKTFWIGCVAVYVVMQALGFVIHGMLMSETYAGLGGIIRPRAETMDLVWKMYVSGAVTAFMFCYIFTKGYEGRGVMEGVRYGALVAFLMAGAISIDPHVIFPLPANVASMWLLSGFVSFMIAGGIFAAIYKPGTAPRA